MMQRGPGLQTSTLTPSAPLPPSAPSDGLSVTLATLCGAGRSKGRGREARPPSGLANPKLQPQQCLLCAPGSPPQSRSPAAAPTCAGPQYSGSSTMSAQQ
jgi:hypothetical protein